LVLEMNPILRPRLAVDVDTFWILVRVEEEYYY